jgi:Rrf2 family cysteine metabolism transcriptional repressor
MKLTSKTEYALLALCDLTRNYLGAPVQIQDIAKRGKMPQRFLEQIMLILKRGGFVKSTRGKSGGYALARHPSKISLAQVIRYFEGALAPTESASKYFYSNTPLSHSKSLVAVMKSIRNFVSKKLESTSLSDIA